MVSKINNSCEGQVTTVIPVVSPVHEASKLERFNEAFDDGTNFLNEKLKKSAKQLSSEKNYNIAKDFIETEKPTIRTKYNL